MKLWTGLLKRLGFERRFTYSNFILPRNVRHYLFKSLNCSASILFFLIDNEVYKQTTSIMFANSRTELKSEGEETMGVSLDVGRPKNLPLIFPEVHNTG